MKFPHQMEPDINFPVLRMHSTNHVWELGIRQMMYGQRVAASRVGEQCYVIDYCCADNYKLLAITYGLVAQILDALPEDISSRDVERTFPRGEFKPINRDPVFSKLRVMAGLEPPPFTVCETCRRASYIQGFRCCDRSAGYTN